MRDCYAAKYVGEKYFWGVEVVDYRCETLLVGGCCG